MAGDSLYERRGVSASKEEVHAAVAGLDKGIMPNAFCKILPDIAGDPKYCSVVHNDTAGTKPSASYLMYKETGDLQHFRNIVVDAIVMNTDDVACSGFVDNLLLSSTIGRNKFLLGADVVKALIEGQVSFIERMAEQGVRITHAGGETADVSDIVRTLDVGATVMGRNERERTLEINIKSNMVIVGFASYGKAIYEDEYNSGMGANGLTNGRHSMFQNRYKQYTETYSPEIDPELVYVGKYDLLDKPSELGGVTVGDAILSPTRTYLPILKRIFEEVPIEDLGGIIHNTGGGQTKVKNFLSKDVSVVKNRLLPLPGIFPLIQATGISWKEMYQDFNMGNRLEVYVPVGRAQTLIDIGKYFKVDAQIIGYTESDDKKIVIESDYGTFTY